MADANVVKINNFRGTQKGLVTFSEAEGVPEFLDLNGKYLAIVSSKGCIKVIDVHTPTKPKQQGSAGNPLQGDKREEDGADEIYL